MRSRRGTTPDGRGLCSRCSQSRSNRREATRWGCRTCLGVSYCPHPDNDSSRGASVSQSLGSRCTLFSCSVTVCDTAVRVATVNQGWTMGGTREAVCLGCNVKRMLFSNAVRGRDRFLREAVSEGEEKKESRANVERKKRCVWRWAKQWFCLTETL